MNEQMLDFKGRLVTKKQLAGVIGCSPRTIDSLWAKRRIPGLVLSGRMVRFDVAKVLAALDKYEVKEAGRH